MLLVLILATVLILVANSQGSFIGCEVLGACHGDVSCIEQIVYRLDLGYCLKEMSEGTGNKLLSDKRGTGKWRMRNILLNSYLNRVWNSIQILNHPAKTLFIHCRLVAVQFSSFRIEISYVVFICCIPEFRENKS
ncbi:hypothetical protein DICVIV_03374 [Dictyocaulus viviparus]|uniref:Uncharacterized protein n=1 Tax=Dictyocaulus viviparus TaxID=29172 RepID=A0A0D8Y349_DICVI|nr:hypothetical protein DICVIV_03374 [Dictyocaulus viviparus]